MKTITIVTGNSHKLYEWERIMPDNIRLESVDIDLDEIQSLDPVLVAKDKAERAFAVVGKPVVVDDVSAGLDELGGLPGTFVKFFETTLGNDALYRLMGKESPCTVIGVVAYYDGTTSLVGIGKVHGTIVSPAGKQISDHGFDGTFVPDGQDKTYQEMLPREKDKISHRKLAIIDLLNQLNDL